MQIQCYPYLKFMATLTLRRAAVTHSRGPKGMKAWQLLFATTNYLYYKITIFPMTPDRSISLPFRFSFLLGWGILLVMVVMMMMILSGPGKRWRLTVFILNMRLVLRLL